MSPAAERFWNTLAEHGQRPALREAQQCLTYTELLAEVEKRSQWLIQHNASRIALALDNGVDWVVWDLAILRAGCVCVPLPDFFSAAQQQHVLDNAGVDWLICPANFPIPTGFGRNGRNAVQGLQRLTTLAAPKLPEQTHKITYTSGTTGQPKGVCLSIDAQLKVAESLWQASESRQLTQHLCILPLATLLENIAGVYAPLLGGACVELRPLAEIGLRGASGFDVQALLSTLQQTQPNSLILLPQLLLALVTAAEYGAPLPDSLRFIAVGGGHVSPQLLARADALKLPIFEGYGLSECASVVCLNTPEARKLGSVGKPLPHVAIKLSDAGEVLVRGCHLLGYLGDSPIPEDQEWLATGDLGHFEDGFLVLHGRCKNQFITAYGRNVNPEWVEAELVQQAPIAQAWLYGEALPENLAVLVPRRPDCSDDELNSAVQDVNAGLPDYAQVHRWIRAEQPFTAANGLATANGRLCRTALIEHYRSALGSIPNLSA